VHEWRAETCFPQMRTEALLSWRIDAPKLAALGKYQKWNGVV
jgi:hypothetical protein